MQKAKKMLTGSVLALIIVFFMVFYTDSHQDARLWGKLRGDGGDGGRRSALFGGYRVLCCL